MSVLASQVAARAEAGRKLWSWGLVPGMLCVPAIWIFASIYTGIDGDARLYIGRALADLDPGGVGRDLMFALDGQTGFTIFRLLAAKLVAILNPANAALALAVVNMTAWFLAMAALVRCFARGRAFAVLMVCAAVLPCPYGFYPLMGSREIVAVPRPLSEAAVLLALAALCAGRTWIPLALLGAAAILHPIMALPGLGVFVLVQGLRDRRWFFAAALGCGAAAAGAWAGLPLLSRLTATIDADWLTVLEDRNPYLFVSHWRAVSAAPLAVQAVTVAISGILARGLQKVILYAVLAVAAAGVMAALILGDMLSLLLAVQVQPWRCLWLVSVLAMPALGLGLLGLPKRGQSGQIALAFLMFAWITFDNILASPAAAGIALALALRPAFPPHRFSPVFVPAVWIVLMGLAATIKWPDFLLAIGYVRALPAIQPDVAGPLWHAGLLPWPFIVLAFVWSRWPGTRLEPFFAAVVLLLLTGLIALTWDARSPASKRLTSNVHDPALIAMLASKPGEVLWLESDDVWYWAGRPQWNSFTQGAGIVFSRPLAMAWSGRTKFLISLGLLDEGQLRPWRGTPKAAGPLLTPPAIAAVCESPEAPAWIVAPLLGGPVLPHGVHGFLWHAPVPQTVDIMADWHNTWAVFDSYAVVPCADRVAARPFTP